MLKHRNSTTRLILRLALVLYLEHGILWPLMLILCYLKSQTRMLVSHQLYHLQQAAFLTELLFINAQINATEQKQCTCM